MSLYKVSDNFLFLLTVYHKTKACLSSESSLNLISQQHQTNICPAPASKSIFWFSNPYWSTLVGSTSNYYEYKMWTNLSVFHFIFCRNANSLYAYKFIAGLKKSGGGRHVSWFKW